MAKKKRMIVGSKAGKKDCRRNVAYKLAGSDGNNKSILCKENGEKFIDRVDPCKVSGKNKEEKESSQKAVVNLKKRIFINKEKNCGNYKKSKPERYGPENNKDGKGKKKHI